MEKGIWQTVFDFDDLISGKVLMAPYTSQKGLDFEVDELHKNNNARGVPVVLAVFFVSGKVWQVTIKANGLLFRLIDNVNHDRLQDLGCKIVSYVSCFPKSTPHAHGS